MGGNDPEGLEELCDGDVVTETLLTATDNYQLFMSGDFKPPQKEDFEADFGGIDRLLDADFIDVVPSEDDKNRDDIDIDLKTIEELAASNPSKKILNLVLLQAVKDRSSDVYIEIFGRRYSREVKIRCKIDGILYEMLPTPSSLHDSLGDRLKVIFGILKEQEKETSIWRRRLQYIRGVKPETELVPREFSVGEIATTQIRIGSNPINMNLSCIKSWDKEQYHIELFLYDQLPGITTLFGEGGYEKIRDMLSIEGVDDFQKAGIILLSSPADQGKTTTAFCLLGELTMSYNNIVAFGKKSGYGVSGIHQVVAQQNEYEQALRSVRQFNPNILLLDDVEDEFTAREALYHASNGAMVIVTVNARDAKSSIEYLRKLVDGKELAQYLNGVISQRIVRRIHEECKETYTPTEEAKASIGEDFETVYHGIGCDECISTGYLGRTSAFQIIGPKDEAMKTVKTDMVHGATIRLEGVTSLPNIVKGMVREGITTITEYRKLFSP